MIVVDASAMADALLGNSSPDLLAALEGAIHAPHLLDAEVTSVLRGLELGRVVTPERAVEALNDYWSFVIERHDLRPLSERVWQLRHQFTSYDAPYIALAEALEAPLVTCDAKLATRGHRAEVLLVELTH